MNFQCCHHILLVYKDGLERVIIMIYLNNIYMSLIVFLMTSFLITVPIIILMYRKYGYFNFKEAFSNYLFVFYLQTLYLLIVLPLPDNQYLIDHPVPLHEFVNLVPFTYINDMIQYYQNHTFSLLTFLNNMLFLQVAFNVIMFIPLGIFLKNRFNFNFRCVIIVSFLLSLFFELTQLSAVYGIYARPYRIFDVDDLFLNTLGGMIGYKLAFLFTWLFNTKCKQQVSSKVKGIQASLVAQYIIFVLDVAIYTILFSILMLPVMILFSYIGYHPVGPEYIFMYIVMSIFTYLLIFCNYLNKHKKSQTPAMRILKFKMISSYASIPASKRSMVIYMLIIFLMQLQGLLVRIESTSILLDIADTMIYGVHIYWMLLWIRRINHLRIDHRLDITIVRTDS